MQSVTYTNLLPRGAILKVLRKRQNMNKMWMRRKGKCIFRTGTCRERRFAEGEKPGTWKSGRKIGINGRRTELERNRMMLILPGSYCV
jgi:hypothetical protein